MVATPSTLASPTAWLATVCVAMLVLAGTAMAAPTPPGTPSSSAGTVTAAGETTFTWGQATTSDAGASIVRYEGGLVASASDEPAGSFELSTAWGPVGLGADGTYFFKVRAVQSDTITETAGPYATLRVVVDRTEPTVTVSFPPPNGLNGWHIGQSGLKITPKCDDATAVSGCTPVTWTAQTKGSTQSFTVTDAAGNTTVATSGLFKFDRIAPTPRGLLSPGPDAKLAAEPTYTWTRFDDGTSGTERYEVQYRVGACTTSFSSAVLLATAPHPAAGVTTVSTVRTVPTPLPINQDICWRVRTFDFAGNSSVTSGRRLRIDPSTPPAPAIMGGPSGSTNVAAPTFSWNGDQPTFRWDVTGPGEDEPAQEGAGTAKEVALKPLADGDYTFRVSQVSPFEAVSAEATRSFEVDTVAPPAPVITRRPTFPTASPAVFSWSIEAGSFGRWTVLGGGGATMRGPSDAPTGSVSLPGLANGAYDFRLVAIDPAGNASQQVSDPFAITGVAAAGGSGASKNALLPKLNASRLRPKAGRVLATRRPVLSWARGPRGTTLYNVQLFRVGKKSAVGRQTIKKVLSSFPRGTRYRTSKKMTPGACYIWRVWPYIGTRFAAKPLGISNFCIASAKVLRAKAAKARRARARR